MIAFIGCLVGLWLIHLVISSKENTSVERFGFKTFHSNSTGRTIISAGEERSLGYDYEESIISIFSKDGEKKLKVKNDSEVFVYTDDFHLQKITWYSVEDYIQNFTVLSSYNGEIVNIKLSIKHDELCSCILIFGNGESGATISFNHY